MAETAFNKIASRVDELRQELGIGLLDARRIALGEDADTTADFALERLHDYLPSEAVELIDQLIKARIAGFPR